MPWILTYNEYFNIKNHVYIRFLEISPQCCLFLEVEHNICLVLAFDSYSANFIPILAMVALEIKNSD